jgi:glycine oxidase
MQTRARQVSGRTRYDHPMEYEWDAVVIGAGIIGLAVGHELARRGARTAILEERTAGAGATQASAGVLAPYIEAPGAGALHELTVRSLQLYDGFIADVQQDAGTAVEYNRAGTLEIATCPESADRLRELAARLGALGVIAEWMDGPEAVRREPALSLPEGALLIGTQGYVRVMQLLGALTSAARARGAVLLEGRKVDRLESGADGSVTIGAGAERYRTRTVVIAAGSWSSRVAAGGATVSPIRGQLVQLRWTGPAITRVLWSELCYIVPWADGTVLVGATVEDAGFDQRTTLGGVRSLMEAACRLLPSASDATFVGARAGLRPSTADGLPLIGRSAVNSAVVYATGHFRNGVLLAPLTAQLVADLVVSNRHDPALALTAPGR